MNYSSIQLANTCLRKYQLINIDRLDARVPKSGDMEFGTGLHMGLNALLEGDSGLDPFSYFWDALKGQNVKYGRFDWEALKRMGEVFLTRFERLHMKNFKPVSMEQRLYGSVGQFSLEGTPDFVGEYKGVPSLIDFKTSNTEYAKEKIITNPQMYLYSHLAKQKLGYEVKQLVYVVFIKSQERIQIVSREITQKEIDSHLETLASVCADLELRKIFPKNFNACGAGQTRCDYFNHCWEQKEINDEPTI